MSAPEAPEGLGERGRALWEAVHATLAAVDDDPWQLDEVEAEVLGIACRAADRTSDLETRIGADGVMVPGSAGQEVAHPLLGELRQTEQSIGRLLDRLRLPSAEDSVPASAASQRARRAAESRWAREAIRRTG